jgi:hypothetical protein
MKTYPQFINESKEKAKKQKKTSVYHSFSTVFGKHSSKDPEETNRPKATSDGPSAVKEKVDYSANPDLPAPSKQHNPFGGKAYYPDKAEDVEKHDEHVVRLGDKLADHYGKPSNPDHRNAIHSYTTDSSEFNPAVAAHHKFGDDLDTDHAEVHKHLHDYLHSHSSPHDLEVFTGTKHSPERFPKDPTTGKIHMTNPAYTSTSISAHTARFFGGHDTEVIKPKYDGEHVLKVHVPKGSPGSYIDEHSQNRTEREFLLPSNSKFHVHPVPETHFGTDHRGEPTKVHVWKASLQPHEG